MPLAPPPEFQWKLVEAYSNERCDVVRDAVKPEMYEKLRPNVRAIVAFCEPKGIDPEKLFASAEKEDPGGDLILVLHAKYLWKKDPEKSLPLWDKVLKLARNASLRSMAQRYLSDEVEEDEPLHLSAWTFQGKAKLGGGYESDPRLPLAPEAAPRRPQAFSAAAISGGVQHWQGFGSLSANYDGSYQRYLRNPELSFWANKVNLPVSLRLGPYEDLVIRPFYGISFGNSREYGQQFGLGVMGVAYRPDYKQSVEGSVFSEQLFDPLVKPEEGAHFRFDYNWEWFPNQWLYRFQALMEHVHAIDDFNNGTNIRFTHTDVGVSFGTKYLHEGVYYSAAVAGAMRFDSLPSEYQTSFGDKASQRRNDFTLSFRPDVTFPIDSTLSLKVAYEFDRTWSPRPVQPIYPNYNAWNHKGELDLVTEFTNY